LRVDGDAGDQITLTGASWTKSGTVSYQGQTYAVFNSDTGLAQVLVKAGLAVNTGTGFAIASAPAGGELLASTYSPMGLAWQDVPSSFNSYGPL
jgi:hypothetical protein